MEICLSLQGWELSPVILQSVNLLCNQNYACLGYNLFSEKSNYVIKVDLDLNDRKTFVVPE